MLQQKQGFSTELLKGRVHAGMMKGRSMRSIIEDIKVAHAERYGKLVLTSAAAINELKFKGLLDPSASFQPWSIEFFLKTHKLPDAQSLTDMWVKLVDPWVYASQQLRGSLEVRKMMMIDGTYKYAKRVKVWVDGKRHQPDEMKLVFFVANEIGQIIQWSFAKSEGHEEIGPLLKEAAKCYRTASGTGPALAVVRTNELTQQNGLGDGQNDDGGNDYGGYDEEGGESEDDDGMSTTEDVDDAGMPGLAQNGGDTEVTGDNNDDECDNDDDDDDGFVLAREYSDTEINTLFYADIDQIHFPDIPESRNIIVMTDNAFAMEKIIEEMGPNFRAGQDPKHLVWRPKKSIHLDYYKTTFSEEFSKQIYRENGQVFERKELFLNIRRLFGAVPADKIKDQLKFNRTFLKALLHIQSGHLTPPNGDNFHWENGISRKLLATSQLECHNLILNDVKPLRCIGPVVAPRVIELTCLKTNISQGEKFARIPPLHGQNIIDLIETTIFSTGVFPSTPQSDFALGLMANLPQLWKSPTEVRDQTRQDPKINQQIVSWSKVFQIPLPPRNEINGALLPDMRSQDITQHFVRPISSAAPAVSSLPHIVESFVTNVLKTTMPALKDQIPFSVEENRLLDRIRTEQVTESERYGVKCMKSSDLVTSILYNEYVMSVNRQHIKTRGLHAIQKALKNRKVDQRLEPSTERILKLKPPVLASAAKDGKFSDVETMFSRRVFATLCQKWKRDHGVPEEDETGTAVATSHEEVTNHDGEAPAREISELECLPPSIDNANVNSSALSLVSIFRSQTANRNNQILEGGNSFATSSSTSVVTNTNGPSNGILALNSTFAFTNEFGMQMRFPSFHVPVPPEFQHNAEPEPISPPELSKEVAKDLKEHSKLLQIVTYANTLSGRNKWDLVKEYAVNNVDVRYQDVASKWLKDTCRNYTTRMDTQASRQRAMTSTDGDGVVNTLEQSNQTIITSQQNLTLQQSTASLKRPASAEIANAAKRSPRQSCDMCRAKKKKCDGSYKKCLKKTKSGGSITT
ncbi:hypothetical protein HDU76_006877, partial [Blyttiomyces sp. JEL0837]